MCGEYGARIRIILEAFALQCVVSVGRLFRIRSHAETTCCRRRSEYQTLVEALGPESRTFKREHLDFEVAPTRKCVNHQMQNKTWLAGMTDVVMTSTPMVLGASAFCQTRRQPRCQELMRSMNSLRRLQGFCGWLLLLPSRRSKPRPRTAFVGCHLLLKRFM